MKIVRESRGVKTKTKKSRVRTVAAKTAKNYRKIKRVHKVRRGENLSVIAKRYDVPLTKLLRYNGLRLNDGLSVGQKIKLVASSRKTNKVKSHVVTYKVKPGDNLQKISKRFGTSVSALKKHNGLRSSKITVEQKLKVVVDNVKTHIVRRGESLIAIANKYKVSMNNILKLNDLKNKSKIQIGKALKIPVAQNQ